MGSSSQAWAQRYYGKPCPPRLKTVKFGKRVIRCHPRAVRAFRRMKRVFQETNPGFFKKLDEGILNDWSFSCRKIAGSSSWSNHAFGIAVDWNAPENYRGLKGTDSQVWRLARDSILKLEREGVFHWGGRWSDPDAMHFEVAMTPAELRRNYTRWGRKKRR